MTLLRTVLRLWRDLYESVLDAIFGEADLDDYISTTSNLDPPPEDWPRAGESLEEYSERRWRELPRDLRVRAVQGLREEVLKSDDGAEFFNRINALMAEHGDDWDIHFNEPMRLANGQVIPVPFHMTQGMSVRNCLRGFVRDDQLPSVHGWDDYYMPALERAAAPDWDPEGEL